MLTGLHPLLTGELLWRLDQMGHSDAVVISDAHFPARRAGQHALTFPAVPAPDLIAAIGDRQTVIADLDGATLAEIPADAVTASSSGLDPHISPEYARLQIDRVADARSLDRTAVAGLVESMIQGRDLGYLGEPTVNVLALNMALEELAQAEMDAKN